MGLLEFLTWCEDLHMEPLLAVFSGYSLRQEHVPAGKDLEPYVQDALDEIEYITGDTSTHWGAERAKDGHPARQSRWSIRTFSMTTTMYFTRTSTVRRCSSLWMRTDMTATIAMGPRSL
jgi:alpha-L-arabinofuranosidase